MHIDIEKLASGYGERAIADGRYTLSKGDYIMSLDELKRYTALVLEEVKKAVRENDLDASMTSPDDKAYQDGVDDCWCSVHALSRQITEGKP